MFNFEHVRVHVLVGRGSYSFLTIGERAMGKFNVHEAQFLFERVVEVKLQPPVNTLNQIAEL